MRLAFCFTIFLAQIFLFAKANIGKYTFIGPGCIFSKTKYTAAVAVHHYSQPCQIRVNITGHAYNSSQDVVVSQNQVKNVEFDVPSLGDNYKHYNLTVEGINCLDNFKNTTELVYYQLEDYVSVQTDKGLYKSGDEIKFRVLFMDTDLKPSEPIKDAVISLTDTRRNIIEKINGFNTTRGVYTGKFRIPKVADAGDWIIRVANGGFYEGLAEFRVDDIRSKYVVKVEATDSVSVKDGDIQVNVTANYVSGEPLNGKVTVFISLPYYFSGWGPAPPNVNKIANIVDGKVTMNVNVKDDYLGFIRSVTQMDIKAIVEEQITGDKISATTRSFIYPNRYTMICTCSTGDSCFSFIAGKENDMHFQIIYLNGSYVNDTKSVVEFSYMEDNDDDKSIFTFKGHMNETGFVNFKVTLPQLAEQEGSLRYYQLTFKYLDEYRYVLYTYQEKDTKNPKEYFMLADQYLNNKLHLNQPHLFTVKSSQPLSYVIYNIAGRRNILHSVRIDLPDKPKEYNFTLTPELSWAPSFQLYVYYVDEKGEYHYDEKKYLTFEQLNPITVTAPEKVKPGQEVNLKIQTAANSFVGLMAVDQHLLLQKKNNDLELSDLKNVWKMYSGFVSHPGGYSRYPGSISGCVTLTNADYFYSWISPPQRPNLGLDEKGGVYRTSRQSNQDAIQIAAVAAFDEAGNGSNGQSFKGTSILTDISNTTQAVFTQSIKIPEYKTSWVLTAFSFNPSKGLGITETAIKITAN